MNAFMLIVNIIVMSLTSMFLVWFSGILFHYLRRQFDYAQKQEKIRSLFWFVVVAILTLAALACTIYDFVLLVS